MDLQPTERCKAAPAIGADAPSAWCACPSVTLVALLTKGSYQLVVKDVSLGFPRVVRCVEAGPADEELTAFLADDLLDRVHVLVHLLTTTVLLVLLLIIITDWRCGSWPLCGRRIWLVGWALTERYLTPRELRVVERLDLLLTIAILDQEGARALVKTRNTAKPPSTIVLHLDGCADELGAMR